MITTKFIKDWIVNVTVLDDKRISEGHERLNEKQLNEIVNELERDFGELISLSSTPDGHNYLAVFRS